LMRIHIEEYGIGDHLAVTAFVREFKRRWPEELITIASRRHVFLWDHNPHLNHGKEEIIGSVVPKYKNAPALGNMPRQMCMNFGFIPEDTHPEIFLTDHEKGFGLMVLQGMKPPIVCLDYHATHPARRWPLERFQEVVQELRKVGISTVEIGGNPPKLKADRALSQGLHVRQTAAILTYSNLYMGNDSGSFHLAASVGVPQVVVFGPTKSREYAYESTASFDDFLKVEPSLVVKKCLGILETVHGG